MVTSVQHPKSTTTGNVPNTTQCNTGQLALNLVDFRLFTSNGTVVYDAVQNVSTNFYVGQTLTVNTALSVGNSTVNAVINSTTTIDNTLTFTTTGTASQTFDSFLIASYRTSKYIISVKDNVANNYLATEILVVFDGTNPQMTEYASLATNTIFGTFSSTSNSTAILMQFTPTSANTTIKFSKRMINI